MDTKEKIKVMQHYADGGKIEFKPRNGRKWLEFPDNHTPDWSWDVMEFRIKPEPQLRPYNSAKEFLQAQKEHGIYMFITGNSMVRYMLPTEVYDNSIRIPNGDIKMFTALLGKCIWQDGTPCGIIEE